MVDLPYPPLPNQVIRFRVIVGRWRFFSVVNRQENNRHYFHRVPSYFYSCIIARGFEDAVDEDPLLTPHLSHFFLESGGKPFSQNPILRKSVEPDLLSM
jgi:hypothetical protein